MSSDDQHEATQAFQRIPQLIAQLKEYARHYAAARASLIGAKVRGLLFALVMMAVLGLLAVALLFTAAVLLLVGAGQGLGHLFGDRIWLGYLAVGAAVLILSVVGVRMVISGLRKTALEATTRLFEQRKERERTQFTSSIVEASHAVPAGLGSHEAKEAASKRS